LGKEKIWVQIGDIKREQVKVKVNQRTATWSVIIGLAVTRGAERLTPRQQVDPAISKKLRIVGPTFATWPHMIGDTSATI
jgi:hypothetical protein